MMHAHDVVVVGGGLSGLSAAIDLASRGCPVTVLEQKPMPGGRAYSFKDVETGDMVDNGQHVLIAGYHHTMHMLERIGTAHLLRVQSQPRLRFHHPDRGFRSLVFPRLRPPWNFLAGILSGNLLPFRDRLRLLKAGRVLMQPEKALQRMVGDHTIDEWLKAAGQSNECRRSFWEPLAVAIMNERTETASALVFARSLRKAFFGHWRNASLALPSVGLSELYVDGALNYIALRGGRVLCGADVTELLFDGDHVAGVRLKSGVDVECTAVILAVPPYRLSALLPAWLRQDKRIAAMESIPSSPIVSIHLWFAHEVMSEEFVGLIGRRVHWVFNKRKINGGKGRGGHISAVISAAHDVVGLSNEELIRIAMEDLRGVYPDMPERPVHHVIVREKRATYSSRPDIELLRPGAVTPCPNLFLAGDYTDTGYPATIEGAIISGERAASCAYERVISGNPASVAHA
jgi:squalene-associated FAD-dependent desaturase